MSSTRDPVSIVGESPAFVTVLEQVSGAAPLDRPVLILGERGTGKELIASRLHFLSGRWEQPLVKVNCAALTESLLESELFGHEAGAFTGAAATSGALNGRTAARCYWTNSAPFPYACRKPFCG